MIANETWLTSRTGNRLALTGLIGFHIALCCVSLIYISLFRDPDTFTASNFHIFYEPGRLHYALIAITAFAPIALLFIYARFSFGYLIGFYFYAMILSYLWINCFSDLDYNHWLGGFSAAAGAVAYLLPSLLISSPIRQQYVLSAGQLKNILTAILWVSIATVATGAIYNFRFVSLTDIYHFRDQLQFPLIIRYALGITSNALLPFAFACFVTLKNYRLATVVLVLLLVFYPITLSKLAFFTPAWLVLMAFLSRMVQARTAVVLSLMFPMLVGVLLVWFKTADTPLPFHLGSLYFYIVNFRIVAVPAAAMDVYGDFFSKHDLTHFCQISVLKLLISCPYQEQLSIVLERAYKLGNYNASLFATEGIASVGPWLAPIAVLVSGFVIALGSRLSAGLPPHFILTSAAVFPQILLNVPLSTALVTHGLAILFLLWYITPRTIFDREGAVKSG